MKSYTNTIQSQDQEGVQQRLTQLEQYMQYLIDQIEQLKQNNGTVEETTTIINNFKQEFVTEVTNLTEQYYEVYDIIQQIEGDIYVINEEVEQIKTENVETKSTIDKVKDGFTSVIGGVSNIKKAYDWLVEKYNWALGRLNGNQQAAEQAQQAAEIAQDAADNAREVADQGIQAAEQAVQGVAQNAAQLAADGAAIAAMNAEMVAMTATMAAMTELMAANLAAMAAMTAQTTIMGGWAGLVSAINQIGNLFGGFDNLTLPDYTYQIQSLTERLSAVEQKINELDGDNLSSVTDQITYLQNQVQILNTNVITNTQDIELLKVRIQDLTKAETNIDSMKWDINNNYQKHLTLSSTVSTHTTQITKLQTDVSANYSQQQTLSSTVTTQGTSITTTNTNVQQLKDIFSVAIVNTLSFSICSTNYIQSALSIFTNEYIKFISTLTQGIQFDPADYWGFPRGSRYESSLYNFYSTQFAWSTSTTGSTNAAHMLAQIRKAKKNTNISTAADAWDLLYQTRNDFLNNMLIFSSVQTSSSSDSKWRPTKEFYEYSQNSFTVFQP